MSSMSEPSQGQLSEYRQQAAARYRTFLSATKATQPPECVRKHNNSATTDERVQCIESSTALAGAETSRCRGTDETRKSSPDHANTCHCKKEQSEKPMTMENSKLASASDSKQSMSTPSSAIKESDSKLGSAIKLKENDDGKLVSANDSKQTGANDAKKNSAEY